MSMEFPIEGALSENDIETRIVVAMEALDFEEADHLLDELRAQHSEPKPS